MVPSRFFRIGLAAFSLSFLLSCGGDRGLRQAAEEGVTASLVEKEDLWRGGILGGALGPPFAGKIHAVAEKAMKEAARENRPVVYVSTEGFQRVEAFPLGQKGPAGCRPVKGQFFQGGRQVSTETKEVCP